MQPTYPYIFVRGKKHEDINQKMNACLWNLFVATKKKCPHTFYNSFKKGHYTHIIIVDIKEMYGQQKNPKCI